MRRRRPPTVSFISVRSAGMRPTLGWRETCGGRCSMARREPIAFDAEVQRFFQFLVDSYGMAGPEYSELLLPGVLYERPELRVWVFLQAGDGAGTQIDVDVCLPNRDWPAKAELRDLVEAAVFAPRHRVAHKAHTPDAARKTLDENATWLRRLMPLLLGPDVEALMRKANERQVDCAGNPKKRGPDVKWKFD